MAHYGATASAPSSIPAREGARSGLPWLTDQANSPAKLKQLATRKLFEDCHVLGAVQETQIVQYNHDKMGDLRVLLWPWVEGSIFRRCRIWWQIAVYFVLTIGITAMVLVTFKEPAKIKYTAAQNLSAYFNVFLPFLFGIYLNIMFTRWWNMRTLGVSTLNNSLNNLCMIVASHVRGHEGVQPRHLLLRYGLLSHELVYRGARKTDGDLRDLVQSGALMEEERRSLQDLPGPVKAQAVWSWIQLLLDEQFRRQRIPAELHMPVQTEISTGRTAVKSIFTTLSTPIPFAYVHLMACLVHINLLLLVLQASLACAAAIGKVWLLKHGSKADIEKAAVTEDTEGGMLLFAQFCLLVMVPMLYLGYLELAYEITDPFGTDANDFPRAVIHNTMQDECEGFFKVTEAPPPELQRLLEDPPSAAASSRV